MSFDELLYYELLFGEWAVDELALNELAFDELAGSPERYVSEYLSVKVAIDLYIAVKQ